MTGPELVALLELRQISTRDLAHALGHSAMWVSRRRTGEVPITEDEALTIRIVTAEIVKNR